METVHTLHMNFHRPVICHRQVLGALHYLVNCNTEWLILTGDFFQLEVAGASKVSYLVSWCFKPSQPQRITSGQIKEKRAEVQD